MIDITRMTRNKTLTKAVFSEAADILEAIGQGTGNVIGSVGEAIANIFGSIGSGSASVVHELAGGIKAAVSPIVAAGSSVLKIINEALQWIAILMAIGYTQTPECLKHTHNLETEEHELSPVFTETNM